jgi:hypothetical protein
MTPARISHLPGKPQFEVGSDIEAPQPTCAVTAYQRSLCPEVICCTRGSKEVS